MIDFLSFDSHGHYSSIVAVDGATALIKDAMAVNQDAIASWNDRWETIFDSSSNGNTSIFAIISSMSIFAGVTAIVIWMIDELKDFDGDGQLFKRSFYINLLWALFIMALLVPPGGGQLGNLVKGLHTFGQNFNQQVLAYQMDSVALEDAVRASVNRGTLQAEISAQISQCEAYTGQDQYNCLSNAYGQVQQLITNYEDQWLLPLPDAYRDVERKLENALYASDNELGPRKSDVVDASGGNPGVAIGRRTREGAVEGFQNGEGLIGRAVGGVSGLFLGALGSVIQGFTHGLLLALQWGFVNSLEMAMLLTAMIAPFALALSFIPGKGRPIIAWVLAYLSMVMVQFYYNIFIGIIGVVIVNSNAYDMNGYLLVLAIFGPVLAVKLAQGGGIAVFDTITSGSIGLGLASLGLTSRMGKSKR